MPPEDEPDDDPDDDAPPDDVLPPDDELLDDVLLEDEPPPEEDEDVDDEPPPPSAGASDPPEEVSSLAGPCARSAPGRREPASSLHATSTTPRIAIGRARMLERCATARGPTSARSRTERSDDPNVRAR